MSRSPGQQASSRFVLTVQGAIVVVALAVIFLFGIDVKTDGMAAGRALWLGSLGGVLTYLFLLALSRVDWLFPSGLQRQVRELRAFATSYSWPVILMLALLAGVGEELLFRGVIQGWLTEHVHATVGIIAAALLFGAVHFLSVAYFLVAALLGLLLGVVYEVSGSILLVMVWHSVYDLAALIVLRCFPGLLLDD